MPADVLHNPILKGFNPDPSIVRVGDDYYIATSTSSGFPACRSITRAIWRTGACSRGR